MSTQSAFVVADLHLVIDRSFFFLSLAKLNRPVLEEHGLAMASAPFGSSDLTVPPHAIPIASGMQLSLNELYSDLGFRLIATTY